MQRHNARIALASYIAKDVLHIAIKHCMYKLCTDKTNYFIHDFIMEKLNLFVDSGDIEDVEVQQFFKKDGYIDDELHIEVKVIPTQIVSYSTVISIKDNLNEND